MLRVGTAAVQWRDEAPWHLQCHSRPAHVLWCTLPAGCLSSFFILLMLILCVIAEAR